MAQAYNHMILPLASERDRTTQVAWGKRDFERRFGRAPAGMWLPETAADVSSLEALAAHGIAFTVLAPRQCKRVRKATAREWIDVTGARVDPSMPYRVDLPSGRSIAVFFYDGPVSQGIAFEGLLHRGDLLASRLATAFDDRRDHAELSHVATDGETYGHHHRGGEMALAVALDEIERKKLARVTCYAEMLARHPPTYVAEIIDDTSWSCVHGVERWRSDCGCHTGSGRSQAWRAPLRAAFDWLHGKLAAITDGRGRELSPDPWAARDAYIDVVLDRSDDAVARFLATHALPGAAKADVLSLLEMQRNAMLMYTSCGWFFDDLGGIEPAQVMSYAARAAELGEGLSGQPLLAELGRRLAAAKSNDELIGDGERILDRILTRRRVDANRAALHHATLGALDEAGIEAPCLVSVHPREERIVDHDDTRLVLGRASVVDRSTSRATEMIYVATRGTELDVRAAARPSAGDDIAGLANLLGAAAREGAAALEDAAAALIGPLAASLDALHGDTARAVMSHLSAEAASEEEASCAARYVATRPLLLRLATLGVPPPTALVAAAEVALSARVATRIGEGAAADEIAAITGEARAVGAKLRPEPIESAMLARLSWAADRAVDAATVVVLAEAIDAARALPFRARTDEARSRYLSLIVQNRVGAAPALVRALGRLGDALGIPLGAALT
jgi:hypothetical protein